jgi:hypothetical protein
VRSSLTLLAALGAALALAGVGDGADNERPKPGLDPNVALEIRAARPARTLPVALRTLAADTSSPAVARAIRAGLAAPARAGLRLRPVLAPFSAVVLSVERACPPPAVLACRPAVRFIGRLRSRASQPTRHEVGDVLVAELEAAGFENLHAQPGTRSGLASRITSRGETLARWRLDDRVLEVVTGGLAPRAGAAAVGGSAALPETPAGSTPAVLIDVNASLLASLGGDTSP